MNMKFSLSSLVAAAALSLGTQALAANAQAAHEVTTYQGLAAGTTAEGQMFDGVSPTTLRSIGGEHGAQVWVDGVLQRVTLNSRLIGRYDAMSEAQRAGLNELLLKMVLGGPIDRDDPALQAIAGLQLSTSEFNQLIEAAYDTCEQSRIRYHDCNRIIAAMGPVRPIVMGPN
ncbi:hypothetical protein E4T66_01880 [Sinimarinibacterium sp. CAU 1509]|uniref:hypothetical protein n=1 Tax=Sinimarinibacterium sp. CAU 1509 TaxID=2562283 RepID=UPI0010AB8F1B|nr:hypothetical protein [Sinimarinibacterium sp. CAU 1509]TJY64997.1 hypothetical protein E4T66_01880 [Sinimarinibacterium sp. CAU 1509]